MPVPPYRRSPQIPSRLLSDLELASRQSGSGDLGFTQDGGGFQILDQKPEGLWVVIDAQPDPALNAYGFTRVNDGTGDGTFPDLAGTTETSDGDTLSGNLIAWEVNGRTDVATDGSVKVRLEPNRCGPGYTFTAPTALPTPWVHYRATASINISSPGSTTANFDGQTPSVGDRVLLPQQSSDAENGPYIYNGSGVAMTRCPDFSTAAQLTGATVLVLKGTVWAGTYWACTTAPTIVVDTTSLTWAQTPLANTRVSGLMSFADQSFLGRKTFYGSVTAPGSPSLTADPNIDLYSGGNRTTTSYSTLTAFAPAASAPYDVQASATLSADVNSAAYGTSAAYLTLASATGHYGRIAFVGDPPYPVTAAPSSVDWMYLDASTISLGSALGQYIIVQGTMGVVDVFPGTAGSYKACVSSSSGAVGVASSFGGRFVNGYLVEAANIHANGVCLYNLLTSLDSAAPAYTVYVDGTSGLISYNPTAYTGSTLPQRMITLDDGIHLPQMADATATIYTVYWSTTGSKVAFKDGGGTVTYLGGTVAWGTITGTPTTLAGYGITDGLVNSNNLSDLTSASTARTNLGLGTAATAALSSLCQAANNLSDLASAATARANLGLGSLATATAINCGGAT